MNIPTQDIQQPRKWTPAPEEVVEERTISQMSHSSQIQPLVAPFLLSHTTPGDLMSPNLDNEYCYRHNPRIRCNKSADSTRLTEIQNQLEKLPRKDQASVTNVWSIFSKSNAAERNLILQGLVAQCCFPQLSLISQEIGRLLKIDFLEMLPSELGLKILCYLDCQSLCNAAQVSTKWKQLADDDRVWRYMCEQHIDRKCPQCGWGLPLMAVKKLQEGSLAVMKRREPVEEHSTKTLPPPLEVSDQIQKQQVEQALERKRKQVDNTNETNQVTRKKSKRRPWKAVYSERYQVERNWRKGYYAVKNFEGHTGGILCCAFDNQGLLMSGSYDKTIKIWNTDTGELLRTLVGHTMGVKALAFDEQKLITGGLDKVLKVWNWRTGECISSYPGHREGVISVDFYDKIIVSGSADKTIKVWHIDSRTCYTLRGHVDWVTNVKIHAKSGTLFSCSDDTTVRLWDLKTNDCLKVYEGHNAQIQTVIPFTYNETLEIDEQEDINLAAVGTSGSSSSLAQATAQSTTATGNESDDESDKQEERNPLDAYVGLPTHMLTASLDNTIKLWDVRTGKCLRTQFGHIEGIWSIAADTFRIVSGSQDKTIKIWDLQSGQCMHTFGQTDSVSSVALGDSRVVCGMSNGDLKMLCFDKKQRTCSY